MVLERGKPLQPSERLLYIGCHLPARTDDEGRGGRSTAGDQLQEALHVTPRLLAVPKHMALGDFKASLLRSFGAPTTAAFAATVQIFPDSPATANGACIGAVIVPRK